MDKPGERIQRRLNFVDRLLMALSVIETPHTTDRKSEMSEIG